MSAFCIARWVFWGSEQVQTCIVGVGVGMSGLGMSTARWNIPVWFDVVVVVVVVDDDGDDGADDDDDDDGDDDDGDDDGDDDDNDDELWVQIAFVILSSTNLLLNAFILSTSSPQRENVKIAPLMVIWTSTLWAHVWFCYMCWTYGKVDWCSIILVVDVE